jgi:small subunit ribosomal protein S3
MSHTVHPYSHRLGIIRDWKSRWFGVDKVYRKSLKADLLVREFLAEDLRNFFVGGIDIERNAKTLRIIIKTARPGMSMPPTKKFLKSSAKNSRTSKSAFNDFLYTLSTPNQRLFQSLIIPSL